MLVPKGRNIRPTSDKIRGAIFNSLTSRGEIEGMVVLDCFCGTGALGLEALSRGSARCIFIDKNRLSLNLARENAKNLGVINKIDFILSDVIKLKASLDNIPPANIAFLDPPYNKGMVLPALNILHNQGWLADGALCVIEAEKKLHLEQALFPDYQILNQRNYGDTGITFLRYVSLAI